MAECLTSGTRNLGWAATSRYLSESPKLPAFPRRVLDGPNRYLGSDRAKYGPNGYMTLEFDNARLVEKFFLPDATPLLEQELKPGGSVVVIQTV